jgi:hypothetical protein
LAVIAAAVLYLATPKGITILIGLPVAVAGALLRAIAAESFEKIHAWRPEDRTAGRATRSISEAFFSRWASNHERKLDCSIAADHPVAGDLSECHSQRRKPPRACSRKISSAIEARVPRFVPAFHRFERSFSFSQYLANREYNTALGFTATLAVFIVKWRLI